MPSAKERPNHSVNPFSNTGKCMWPMAMIVEVKPVDIIYPSCSKCKCKIPYDPFYDDTISLKCSTCASDPLWQYKLELTCFVYMTSEESYEGVGKLDTCLVFDEVAKDIIGVSANDFAVLSHYRNDIAALLDRHLRGKMCCIVLSQFRDVSHENRVDGSTFSRDPIAKSLSFLSPDKFCPLFDSSKATNHPR
ncbi:hypothetical protein MP638_006716 [Amoeboaphelidium occidentale]|nr:hypothetical protein MP638_006716 [Amoeboaphelidium occidentale]